MQFCPYDGVNLQKNTYNQKIQKIYTVYVHTQTCTFKDKDTHSHHSLCVIFKSLFPLTSQADNNWAHMSVVVVWHWHIPGAHSVQGGAAALVQTQ